MELPIGLWVDRQDLEMGMLTEPQRQAMRPGPVVLAPRNWRDVEPLLDEDAPILQLVGNEYDVIDVDHRSALQHEAAEAGSIQSTSCRACSTATDTRLDHIGEISDHCGDLFLGVDHPVDSPRIERQIRSCSLEEATT